MRAFLRPIAVGAEGDTVIGIARIAPVHKLPIGQIAVPRSIGFAFGHAIGQEFGESASFLT